MDKKLFFCRICGSQCRGSHTLFNHIKLHNLDYSNFKEVKLKFFSETENYIPLVIKSSLVRIKKRGENMDKKELLEDTKENKKEEETYNDWRCAECNFRLDKKYKYCPSCGCELDWERVVNDEEFY